MRRNQMSSSNYPGTAITNIAILYMLWNMSGAEWWPIIIWFLIGWIVNLTYDRIVNRG